MFNSVVADENLYTIEELGFKIGIGVATGADHIFVSKELPKFVEKELLLPALNAKNLTGNKLQWNGEYLLNPYTASGELIKLSDYPLVEKYLNLELILNLLIEQIIQNYINFYIIILEGQVN
jgi:hypothetical protein